MSLQQLNTAAEPEARQWLLQCCASEIWVSRLLERRPFAGAAQLREAADRAWRGLPEKDYLQAFAGHPKIGDLNSLRDRYADTSPHRAPRFVARASKRSCGGAHGRKDAEGIVGATHASPLFEGVRPATASDSTAAAKAWRPMRARTLAAGEQSGVEGASHELIEELQRGNRAYQEKFGFIFIVCATGKSAGEMLELLQQRLPNSREIELDNAVREQRKIFLLRLEKLL